MPSRWKTIDRLRFLATGAYVYVLYDGEKPVYVGSSSNLYFRLYKHRAAGMPMSKIKISGDRKYGEFLMREFRLIAKMNPKLNQRGCSGGYRPWADPTPKRKAA